MVLFVLDYACIKEKKYKININFAIGNADNNSKTDMVKFL